MAKIDGLLARLDKVKGDNGKWLACCPAHHDRSPSLAIKYDAAEDKVLLKCFAGCGALDIVAAIGMGLEDLMPERVPDFSHHKGKRLNKVELFNKLIYEASILRVACEDLIAGKQLPGDDIVRALGAIGIIDEIKREVGHVDRR